MATNYILEDIRKNKKVINESDQDILRTLKSKMNSNQSFDQRFEAMLLHTKFSLLIGLI